MSNLHARDPRKYSVEVLCVLFGVSKQAYYKRDDRRMLIEQVRCAHLLKYVRSIREVDPGIGGRKLWYMYKRDMLSLHPIGRDKFESLLDTYGLKVRKKKRKTPRTTDSTHGLPTYPNLIKDLIPVRPNQLWVGDITYVEIYRNNTGSYIFCYLAIIMDAYTEEIVGYSVGDTLETCYPIEALKMAMERLGSNEIAALIHHSDRGVQYASIEYTNMLKAAGISISMTECGDPKDNAQAERINNTVKNELFKGKRFRSIDEVREAMAIAVAFYNNERPHMSLNMMTPSEAALHSGERTMLWHSLREDYIRGKDNLVDSCKEEKQSLSLSASMQLNTAFVNQIQV